MNRERTVHFFTGWLLLAIFIVALFPHRDLALRLDIPRQGTIANRTYVAPISFDVLKSASQLKHERLEAQNRVYAVFEYNSDATSRILDDFHQTMRQIREFGVLQARLSQRLSSTESQRLSKELGDLQQALSQRLSTTAIHHLSIHPTAIDALTQAYERIMNSGVSEFLLTTTPRQGTLYQEYHNLSELKSLFYTKQQVTLIRNNREILVEASKIRPREAIIEDAFALIQPMAAESQGLQSAFYEALHAFTQPNIFYLDKETESRKQSAAKQVNTSKGMIVKGMEIIPAGAIVTSDAIEKLEALADAIQKEQGQRSVMTSGFGQAIFLLAISLLFCFYLVVMSSRERISVPHFWALISAHSLQIIAFFGIDALAQGLSNSNVLLPEGAEMIWLQPFLLAPVLSTVLFHLRVGLISALFTATLFGMQANYDLTMSLMAFLVIWATILFLHQIRYRYHFILSSILGICALILAIMVSLLLRNRMNWEDFWPPVLLGSIAILTTVSICSLFLIHLFEKFFGITTNLTLMELSDFNHPALKRLSERAPGSFHHSIMVGNLAEAAATRIGANPLLTRVIALYHDIGKSEHPAFFTENQKRGENPHDPLEPTESMQIIRNHVVDGLRLAKEYKLPQRVSAGIPEHHGDNVIHYFYRKALLQKLDHEIPMADFRYPGPRPQSKETALVMLADSIEATSRSMDEPDAALLSKLVQDVIQTRLQEDQLRDSKLSINDLEEIEIGFLQSLEGMFHTRIQYPEGVFISIKKPARTP